MQRHLHIILLIPIFLIRISDHELRNSFLYIYNMHSEKMKEVGLYLWGIVTRSINILDAYSKLFC